MENKQEMIGEVEDKASPMAEEADTDAEADESSTLTMERVAAAKQYIETHYKEQMKHIQERKERYMAMF